MQGPAGIHTSDPSINYLAAWWSAFSGPVSWAERDNPQSPKVDSASRQMTPETISAGKDRRRRGKQANGVVLAVHVEGVFWSSRIEGQRAGDERQGASRRMDSGVAVPQPLRVSHGNKPARQASLRAGRPQRRHRGQGEQGEPRGWRRMLQAAIAHTPPCQLTRDRGSAGSNPAVGRT